MIRSIIYMELQQADSLSYLQEVLTQQKKKNKKKNWDIAPIKPQLIQFLQ